MEEVLAAGIEITALQLLLVGVGDGMDQEVEPAPGIPQRGECGVQARRVGDVAGQDQRRAQRRRQRLHAPPECFPLRSEESRVGKEYVSTCESRGWPDT